ncbi:MAG: type II toxin-antitoxin system HicB family antitoxin, partial [Planctomycetota bacterium]
MRLTEKIKKEENWYVARCIEMNVIRQGKKNEEEKKNLQEAIELYLESFG